MMNAMVVARSWSSAPPPFGLDGPMALLGGDRIGPFGVAGRLGGADRLALVEHVAAACAAQVAQDRCWFRMPPLLLVGEDEGAALAAARRLAWEAGVPLVRVDLSDGGVAVLGRRPAGPDAGVPSMVAMMLAHLRCANPLIVVDGLPEAEDARLAAAIDPARGCVLHDGELGVSLDLSEVSWLLLGDRGERRADWLDGLAVPVFIQTPAHDAAVELDWIEALAEEAADRGLHGAADELAWSRPPSVHGRPCRPHAFYAADARAAFDAAYGPVA